MVPYVLNPRRASGGKKNIFSTIMSTSNTLAGYMTISIMCFMSFYDKSGFLIRLGLNLKLGAKSERAKWQLTVTNAL